MKVLKRPVGHPPSSRSRAGHEPSWSDSWPLAATTFALALAWRGLFLVRLHASPLRDLLEADSLIFWEWARAIREHGWLGSQPFFLGPLYAYVLAACQTLLGTSVLSVQLGQSLLSSASIALLALLVDRLHGRRWAWSCGLWLAGFGPWVFADAQVLMEPLLLAMQVALLACVVLRQDRPVRTRDALAMGLVVGLMALGRPTNLLLLLPLAFATSRPGARRHSPRLVALMLLTVASLALPTGLRSREVSGQFIPYTYSLGYNLYVGNSNEATGGYASPAGGGPGAPLEGGVSGDGRDILRARTGREYDPLASSDAWRELAWRDITTSPGRWLRLMGRKFALLFNDEEPAQIQSTRVYERVAGPLGWPLIGRFGPVGVFGLLGLGCHLATRGASRVLPAFCLSFVIGILPFFVTDRYRIHLVPSLLLLAPFAAAPLLAAAQARKWSQLARAGAVLGALLCFVYWPLVPRSKAKSEYETLTTIAEAHLRRGELTEARSAFQRAIAIDRSVPLPGGETTQGRAARAATYEAHAELAMAEGLWRDAVEDLAMARQLAPDHASVRVAWHVALAADTRTDVGMSEHQQQLPDSAALVAEFVRRIRAAESSGHEAALDGYLRAVGTLVPRWEAGTVARIRRAMARGDWPSAEALLEHARLNGLRPDLYLAHRAAVLAHLGRAAESARIVAELRSRGADTDPVVQSTLRSLPR